MMSMYCTSPSVPIFTNLKIQATRPPQSKNRRKNTPFVRAPADRHSDPAPNDTLTLSYKGGEKTISVPDGAPVVTFAQAT